MQALATHALPGGADPTATSPAPDAEEARHARICHHSIRNHQLSAASYLLDGVFLALFWWAGTVGWGPLVAYTVAGLALCAVWIVLFQSGMARGFADPSANMPAALSNAAVQLVAMTLVPQLGFMFALVLFVIVAFTMRVSARPPMRAWAGIIVGVGIALVISGDRMRIPHDTKAEQVLVWSFFALTLWRCILLGTSGNPARQLLKTRSHEVEDLRREVERLANHDDLTGLLNRRSLLEALTREQHRSMRSGTPLCVAMLDIDGLKSINDHHGHLAGDMALNMFSRIVRRLARGSDQVGRYDGEEFLLILTDTPLAIAERPIARMRKGLLGADWSPVAPGLSLTFSCGVAQYQPGESMESLIQRAEAALTRAKQNGPDTMGLG
jgi:diguanylate cyclase (GGDEF)-like protein